MMVIAVPLDDLRKIKVPSTAYTIQTELSVLDNESWMLAALERIEQARLGFELGGVNLGTVH